MKPPVTLIDSHAHLGDDRLYPDVSAILLRAQQAGIETIINICTDALTLERGLQLHQEYPWIYNAAATPPHDVVADGETVFPLVAKAAHAGKLVAVGETGLDYHYHTETRELQKKIFIRYLHLALECGLPIVIHCREAFEDFFAVIDAEYKEAPGVLHCFTGTMQEAQQLIDRDWYVSLSGIVTYKKSEELREVAKIVPLNRLLIETDAPYLAPQSKRGKTNEPAYLVETAQVIAAAKGLSLEELAQATRDNAKKFFGKGPKE